MPKESRFVFEEILIIFFLKFCCSKNREWEKERRNRLNEAFATLCKLLPCYDPATNLTKIDILRNAASYIAELQTKIKDLVSENNEESVKKIKGNLSEK